MQTKKLEKQAVYLKETTDGKKIINCEWSL